MEAKLMESAKEGEPVVESVSMEPKGTWSQLRS